MKIFITLYNKTGHNWLVTIIVMVVALSGCTLDAIEENINSEVTEADLEAASQIVGESLSDDNAGIMSSLNDALTTVSEDGFVRSTSLKSGPSTVQNEEDNSGRGRESNFSYNYDPATGMHTLSFERKVFDGSYSKSVIDTLKYIFTDIGDDFIEYPRQEEDRIETIDFKGFRQGTITSPEKNSFFTRRDTFLIDGVSTATALLNIDGKHYGEGNLEKEKDNGDILERSYQLQVNFLNIVIDKEVVRTNQSLERGVTGTLSWEMIVEQSTNGSTQTKTIRGTIEMNGDGTALLRFRDFKKLFQINLDNGDVRDHDEGFEGRVQSVNIEHNTFKLGNGRIVKITENTKIDIEGDLTTLSQVVRALEDGYEVWSEGTGFADGEVFVARRLRFETEGDGADEISFEAYVSNVNLDTYTITLQDERVILIKDGTQIDESGDYHTLAGVKEALQHGIKVIADGKAVRAEEEGIDLIATYIRFDRPNDGTADEVSFEDILIDVKLDARTITLEDSTVIYISQETEIDQSGDLKSLEAVREAYELEKTVISFGKAVHTEEQGIDLIATHVKFNYQN